MAAAAVEPTEARFEVFGPSRIDRIAQLAQLPASEVLAMKAVAAVFPFRVNRYVIDELIDWSAVPDDPMFQLTFPQRGMLGDDDFARMERLILDGVPAAEIESVARTIRRRLNPHPGGQEYNTPGGSPAQGIQHKYRETVLLFPNQGQTCHSYCTYCFRWAQFVGPQEQRFGSREPERLAEYVREHPEVRSVLFTGGDPMVMKTSVIARYVEPLLGIEHVRSIRFGTKALAYWPHRFAQGEDADNLLRLFERISAADKHVALMGHYSLPRELETPVAQTALSRCISAGAVVRTQAPVVRHVNDNVDAWARLWRLQVQLGAVPYYFFVERDTGASRYFDVPLVRALDVFSGAYQQLSGLGRTVRGPSMSCNPGKVVIDGIADVAGERVFVLKMLQARDPAWVRRPFFAAYDAKATWIDDLRPAFGESEFFWEPGLRERLRPATREPHSERVRLTTLATADAE